MAHSIFCKTSEPSTSRQSLRNINEFESSANRSFDCLIPLPKKKKNEVKTRKGPEKQHSEILTSTPKKAELQKKIDMKKMKELSKKIKQEPKEKNLTNKKTKGGVTKKGKKTKNPQKKPLKKIRRSLNFESETEDEDQIDDRKLCDDDELGDLPGRENEETCFLCEEYGRDGEEWYRCTSCGIWVHSLCSGFDSPDNYICDRCFRKY